MKLDKIKFARLVAFISSISTIGHDDIEELDRLIDIDVQPVPSGQIDPAAVDKLLFLMAKGTEKIEAIKQYRLMTGQGLKESKDAIERYWPNGVYETFKN